VWESATLPAVPKLGFFAAMKERLCRLTGLIHSPAEIAEDTAGEPEGFLATVESHLKRLSQVTTIAELSSWAMKAIELALTPPNPERPLLRGKARGKREKKGPHTEAPQYGNDLFTNLPDQQDSNPFREVERHSWDSGAPSVDLTVQALHVVAEATRAEQAKEKKRRHDSFQEDLRRKGTTRDTLKRSAGEGIRGVDAAPILRELDGVYGTVEVAERQFRELAERRKRSQG
jgi:hypothetical protein